MKSNSKELAINEEIGFADSKMLRVVGNDGEQLGMLTYAAALDLAYEKGVDLVLIAPQAEPPVCRVMDYGKFRFERDKKEKEARKKQQIVDIKEIQLTCRIDTNDFNTKLSHAKRFLSGGDKVKVIVKFKGRQMAHQEIGRELLAKFEEACAEHGTVEKRPVLEGRAMSMMVIPLKASAKKAKEEKPKDEKPAAENKDQAPEQNSAQ
ncbi:MAG: translation initiation factor IF-3 [Ruminococcaceae bacterium]|nr:translation initiation factor IF-3 [Oscillospiraceae bacterium]